MQNREAACPSVTKGGFDTIKPVGMFDVEIYKGPITRVTKRSIEVAI